jgi:adenylylsulfate reductase subunit A
MTQLLKDLGVPLPCGADGKYIPRSVRSIAMLGEQLKPLLAEAVRAHGISVLNRTPAYRLLKTAEDNRIAGAAAYNLRSQETIIATAGNYRQRASGIYRSSIPACPPKPVLPVTTPA